MSNRHRRASDQSRPSRAERVEEHRRVRHQAHQELSMYSPDDLDDVVVVTPHHTRSDARRTATSRADAAHSDDAATDAPRRRVRAWKLPFWKRRGSERRRRAELHSSLDADE